METGRFRYSGNRDIYLRVSPTLPAMEGREVAILITDTAQEPRILAFISSDPTLCNAFMHNRDPYATVASVAFNVPYEQCLEFHPETKEYQPDGKRRRSEAKTVLLGRLLSYAPLTQTML